MKNVFLLSFVCLLFGCTASKKQPIEVGSKRFNKLSDSTKDSVLVAQGILSTLADSAAYAMGMDYVENLNSAGILGINTNSFTQAIKDALSKKDIGLNTREATAKIRSFVQKLRSPDVSEEEKYINDPDLAYAFGFDYAQNLTKSGLTNFNTHAFVDALHKSLEESDKILLEASTVPKIINSYLMGIKTKQGEINKTKGLDFLAKNKERQEVTVIESGLQYEILTEGTGEKPSKEDIVKVHYHGTLIDGTVFDSSVERGQPASFPVQAVIQGWIEVLQLMPVGSKWKVFIPSDLAYGERGAGGKIGAHTTLIFEIELLEIEEK